MEKFILLVMIMASFGAIAQVGINTINPEATLDVNGDLIVRTVANASSASTYDYLVRNPTTNVVEKVNGNLGTSSVNTTIVQAKETGGLSLLSGSLFAGWQKIDFDPGNVPINPGNHFNAANDFYTVPSDGIYEINYEMRYGNGVLLGLFGTPRIGILKHDVDGYTVLDSRVFSGANLGLLSLTISSSAINSVYRLTTGDQLSFEFFAGSISLAALSNSYASMVVKKISN